MAAPLVGGRPPVGSTGGATTRSGATAWGAYVSPTTARPPSERAGGHKGEAELPYIPMCAYIFLVKMIGMIDWSYANL